MLILLYLLSSYGGSFPVPAEVAWYSVAEMAAECYLLFALALVQSWQRFGRRIPATTLPFLLGALLLTLAAFSFVSCASPVAASAYVPQHHNIPATFAGTPEGPVIWLCATQLRGYGGVAEEDHYLQYSPCPVVPIP